ncbi:MAG: formate dehydrogenase accessory sulfurtransferase FdhD [Terriglobia bacterium]
MEKKSHMSQRQRSIEPAAVSEWLEGKVRRFEDEVASEEPLQIRAGASPLTVTMRTPGHDFELAAGFLFTEGLITRREQILVLEHCPETEHGLVRIQPGGAGSASGKESGGNIVHVQLAPEIALDLERVQRNFFAASSCGICGKASIESVRVRGVKPPNPNFRITPEVLCQLVERLRAAQTVFSRTGGLHAAALFDSRGDLVVLREDVGRHNAADKVAGWALLEGRMPLSEYVLVVSGRGGFEIIQKAVVSGVPVVASVSAPSSLAVQLARELSLTLVGFLRGKRFVVYAGEERLGLGER